jgi:hypothetical protein
MSMTDAWLPVLAVAEELARGLTGESSEVFDKMRLIVIAG